VRDVRVSIVWNINDEGHGTSTINLRWRESNGPKVHPLDPHDHRIDVMQHFPNRLAGSPAEQPAP